jgi:WD40 repeat protein
MTQEFKNKSKPGRIFLVSGIVSISLLVILLYPYAKSLKADTAAAYEDDKPRLMVQPGHSQQVFMTAFSADGRFLVTSSIGKSIKLWDVDSGREIQDLEMDIGTIVSLSFSGDYYRLLCAGMDGKLMLWDIKTGDTTIISSDGVENITTMALSRDGNYALTMDLNSVLSYWDIRNRRLIRNYKVRPENQPWEKNPLLLKPQLGKMSLRMTFSKDGDIAIIGMLDDSIRFQDLKNGRGLRIIKNIYSPNEFFSLAEDGKGLHIIDFNGIRATLPIDETSPIWHNYKYTIDHLLNEKPDKNTPENFMEEKYNIRRDRPENLSGFIYSEENGKILRFYHSNRWQFLDSASGIHLGEQTAPNEKITPLEFVPEQSHVLCSKEDGNLVIVDILDGSIIRRFERHSIPCTSVQFSRDASRITVKGKENQVLNKFLSLTSPDVSLQKLEQNFPRKSSWYSVWDLSTGRQAAFQRELDSEKESTSRSPLRKFYDALQQIQYGPDFPAFIQRLRNFLKTPEELQKVEDANQHWLRGESSAAWKKVAEALHRLMTPEAKIVFDDVELRFERIKAFLPTFANAVEMANHRKAVFTKDNLTFVVAKGNTIDLAQFKKMFLIVLEKVTYEDFKDESKFIQIFSQCAQFGVSLLEGHIHDIQTMAFSHSDDVLLSIAEEGEIKLWDVEKEREIDSWNVAIGSPVKRVMFSSGEQFILLMLENGTLMGMQKNEKKQMFSIKTNYNHISKANSFDFSDDKKMLILGFPDGRCKLFDTQTGKEYGSLFSFIDGTWVIASPNGRFDTNNL